MSYRNQQAIALLFLLATTAGAGRAQGWQIAAKLTPGVAVVNGRAGQEVALNGDRVALAAPSLFQYGLVGSVFVFERSGNGHWLEVAHLEPSDGAPGDEFGVALDLQGDTLVIGSRYHDAVGTGAGAAYVYERSPEGIWSLDAKLEPIGLEPGDWFGASIVLDGSRLVVGANGDDNLAADTGAAYVFERTPGGAWRQTTKLVPSESYFADDFGGSVACADAHILVGATRANNRSSEETGAAYLFELGPDDGMWREVARLSASDGRGFDRFGRDVAIQSDRALVSASGDDGVEISAGSVYVFERDARGEWIETEKLLSPNPKEMDYFGRSIALEGNLVAIGSGSSDQVDNATVYLYARRAHGWQFIRELQAADAPPLDSFSEDVDLDAGRVVIGAPKDDDAGELAGAAYVFDVLSTQPTATLAGRCPGTLVFAVSGYTADGQIELYGGASAGASEVPTGACAGTALTIAEPTLVATGTTGPRGESATIRQAREHWCGALIQVVDLSTCEVGEALQVPDATPASSPASSGSP